MNRSYFLILFLLVSASQIFTQSSINFTASDINGDEIVLSSLLEKNPVMLAFWRSWCPGCKDEQSAMQKLYEKYKPNGFQYIAINVDNQKSVAKVKPYVAAHRLTFPVIIDTDRKIFDMCGANDNVMPYSIIIGKNGEVISTHVGFKSGDETFIEEEIRNFLNIN